MVYKWRAGHCRTVPAQVAGEHLEELRVEHSGLTARVVVDDAKRPESPLHPEFEWDDEQAADEWRLHQARNIMNAMIAVLGEGMEQPRETRAFVVVTENHQDRYTSVAVALTDPAFRQQVLARAFREFEALRRKYAELEELATIFKAIDATKVEVA